MTVSSKVRIYDLAKELKLDTKRLIEEVRREGVDVSVPSNSVSKELAEKIRNKYFPKKETAVKRAVKVVKRAVAPAPEAPVVEAEPEIHEPEPDRAATASCRRGAGRNSRSRASACRAPSSRLPGWSRSWLLPRALKLRRSRRVAPPPPVVETTPPAPAEPPVWSEAPVMAPEVVAPTNGTEVRVAPPAAAASAVTTSQSFASDCGRIERRHSTG